MADLAKNTAPVAVDDQLTILLDAVNVQGIGTLMIAVENVGGGSGNDITDVQIDTSEDGDTWSLDQHAGTPAIPIASGATTTATFTETAAFVRIRALCASGEDTTVKATLSASGLSGSICTVNDIRDRLGIDADKTEYDKLLGRLTNSMESIFDSFTNRRLILTDADVTECYTGISRQLLLKRYPIVAVTSIKQAVDYDFDSADALTANAGYRLVNAGKNGIIYRMYTTWFTIPDCIQVIYRGGYRAAGGTLGSGETRVPDDLREAGILQASFIFKRKDDIGLTSVSFDGGSISKSAPMKLLPIVEQILKKYRRPQL